MNVYDYWVIRYVPDPVRGERVNIGVLAGAGADWDYRRVTSLRRASRLGGPTQATTAFLDSIGRAIEEDLTSIDQLLVTSGAGPQQRRRLSRERVESMRPRMNGIVRLSPPRPVRAESATHAVDLAFDLMVVDDEHTVTSRARTAAISRLRAHFAGDPALRAHLDTSAKIVHGRRSSPVDLAVRGTQETCQLTQVWAFDLRDLSRLETQIDAWNFHMSRIRAGGAVLQSRKQEDSPPLTIPKDVDINAVFIPPRTADQKAVLASTCEGWRDLGIDAVPVTRMESVANEARDLIGAKLAPAAG